VIREATAKSQVARILQKLGLPDRVQAVIYAYETGLVAPGQGSLLCLVRLVTQLPPGNRR
jgi:hypothetical protein